MIPIEPKKIFGAVVIVCIVIAIIFLESTTKKSSIETGNADIKAEYLAQNPARITEQQSQEQPAQETTMQQPKPQVKNSYPTEKDLARIAEKAKKYPRAKELVEPGQFINSESFSIADFVGKNVIMVDFWTYSCINCQRTLPYLNAWNEKYSNNGLKIIGVHAPEFDFEKEYDNVKMAVDKYGIKYAVVQDNDMKTWRAYGNRYWPRKYLLDIDGFIVYDHIGEGSYQETEKKIQELLQERDAVLGLDAEIPKDTVDIQQKASSGIITPEIYFSYGNSKDQLGNNEGYDPETIVGYSLPALQQKNKFYLEGRWQNNKDSMDLVDQAGKVKIIFTAKEVNLVAGADSLTEITILLDGKETKKITVSTHDLYNLVSLDKSGTHALEIQARQGLQAYTFTFG